MTKATKQTNDGVLDSDTVQLLSEAQCEVELSTERADNLKQKIFSRITKDKDRNGRVLRTLSAGKGVWQNLAPKMEFKLLQEDRDAGIQSYLLRLQAGFTYEAHEHYVDEECLVIEGDISFGDHHLQAGDFHFAPAGVPHPMAHTKNGAVLFIRGDVLV